MTYCIAQGALLNVIQQPGWEGSLGENGYMCIYGWGPSLFTWDYHNLGNWLYPDIKLTANKKEALALNPGVRGPCSYNPDGRGLTWCSPSCQFKGQGAFLQSSRWETFQARSCDTIGTQVPLVASEDDGSSSESYQFCISKKYCNEL